MIIIFFAAGIICGWLITLAAEVLPRYAGTPPTTLHAGWRMPALWRLRADRSALPDAVVEIVTGCVFALSSAVYPLAAAALISAVSAFFILTAVIDIRYRLILNVTIYPAFISLAFLQLSIASTLLTSAFLGAGFAFFIFYATARLKPGQLGMGDVKLATLIGFGFGFPGVLYALIIGAGAGAMAAVMMLAGKSKKTRTIPYAPFLCLGALAMLFIPLLGR